MPLEVVCMEKTLTIGFSRFPARLRSFAAHDKLDALLKESIPEIVGEGLDGGMYRQTLNVWIVVDCDGLSSEREDEIARTFAEITEQFCYPQRFRPKKKPVP